MSNRQIVGIIILLMVTIVGIWAYNDLVYHQDAHEIVVVQSPISGELTVSFDAGTHYLGGGKATRYPRRSQVDFDGANQSDGALHVGPVKVLFNDGGGATLQGSLAWEMPTSADKVINLHKLYGSAEAIESQVIVKNINKAIFVTGPLMSSAESYSTRRNDLLSLVGDQIENGAFVTTSRDVQTLDALTGQPKTTRVVEIARNPTNNLPVREDTSLISEAGLHTFNFALSDVEYTETVKAQIASQQSATMKVQTA